jgi:hypothetical protein
LNLNEAVAKFRNGEVDSVAPGKEFLSSLRSSFQARECFKVIFMRLAQQWTYQRGVSMRGPVG